MATKITNDNITSVDAAKLTGTLPAISGANLTGIDALPAVGSSGNVLTSDGTNWASTAAAGGGAWNLIGTAVASNSTSLTITGLSSTYDTYAIALSDFIQSSEGNAAWIRFGDSGGIKTGSSDYWYSNYGLKSTDGGTSGIQYTGTSSDAAIWLTSGSVGNATGEGFDAMLYLNRPTDGQSKPKIHGSITWHHESNALSLAHCAGMLTSVISLDRVACVSKSDNFTSGRMTVWGISHA
jgi:hypothetical protein